MFSYHGTNGQTATALCGTPAVPMGKAAGHVQPQACWVNGAGLLGQLGPQTY